MNREEVNSGVWTNRKLGCFVCSTDISLATSLINVVSIVERSHDRRDCKSRNRVMVVEPVNKPQANSESAVVVKITLNGPPFVAMLDSSAQPSIVDKGTLSSLGINFAASPGRVHGVGTTSVETLG